MTITWSTGAGRSPKNCVEGCRIISVERRGALGADLLGSGVEPPTVTTGEHHLGAFSARSPRGLQTDARAPADHDDALPRELVPRDVAIIPRVAAIVTKQGLQRGARDLVEARKRLDGVV